MESSLKITNTTYLFSIRNLRKFLLTLTGHLHWDIWRPLYVEFWVWSYWFSQCKGLVNVKNLEMIRNFEKWFSRKLREKILVFTGKWQFFKIRWKKELFENFQGLQSDCFPDIHFSNYPFFKIYIFPVNNCPIWHMEFMFKYGIFSKYLNQRNSQLFFDIYSRADICFRPNLWVWGLKITPNLSDVHTLNTRH